MAEPSATLRRISIGDLGGLGVSAIGFVVAFLLFRLMSFGFNSSEVEETSVTTLFLSELLLLTVSIGIARWWWSLWWRGVRNIETFALAVWTLAHLLWYLPFGISPSWSRIYDSGASQLFPNEASLLFLWLVSFALTTSVVIMAHRNVAPVWRWFILALSMCFVVAHWYENADRISYLTVNGLFGLSVFGFVVSVNCSEAVYQRSRSTRKKSMGCASEMRNAGLRQLLVAVVVTGSSILAWVIYYVGRNVVDLDLWSEHILKLTCIVVGAVLIFSTANAVVKRNQAVGWLSLGVLSLLMVVSLVDGENWNHLKPMSDSGLLLLHPIGQLTVLGGLCLSLLLISLTTGRFANKRPIFVGLIWPGLFVSMTSASESGSASQQLHLLHWIESVTVLAVVIAIMVWGFGPHSLEQNYRNAKQTAPKLP